MNDVSRTVAAVEEVAALGGSVCLAQVRDQCILVHAVVVVASSPCRARPVFALRVEAERRLHAPV